MLELPRPWFALRLQCILLLQLLLLLAAKCTPTPQESFKKLYLKKLKVSNNLHLTAVGNISYQFQWKTVRNSSSLGPLSSSWLPLAPPGSSPGSSWQVGARRAKSQEELEELGEALLGLGARGPRALAPVLEGARRS